MVNDLSQIFATLAYLANNYYDKQYVNENVATKNYSSFTYYKTSGFFCKEMPFPADPVQGSRTKTAAGRDLPASAGTQ